MDSGPGLLKAPPYMWFAGARSVFRGKVELRGIIHILFSCRVFHVPHCDLVMSMRQVLHCQILLHASRGVCDKMCTAFDNVDSPRALLVFAFRLVSECVRFPHVSKCV